MGNASGMVLVLTEPQPRSLNGHEREKLNMPQQKVTTILGLVLAFACAAWPALAQTQATTTNATQLSGGQDQSAAAMAQEASNPDRRSSPGCWGVHDLRATA